MPSLTTVRITKRDDPLLQPWRETFATSFPLAEQRRYEDFLELLDDPKFYCLVYLIEGRFLALLVYWDLPDFCYLEYLAIHPQMRKGGQGSKILQQFIREYADEKRADANPIVLGMDIIVDDISQARWNFYQRLGFIKHDFIHEHPAYQPGFEPHKLNILCYARELSQEQLEQVVTQIESNCLPKTS